MIYQEEFEDTKWAIRIRKSKKERQHNGQKQKDQMTNNDLKTSVGVGEGPRGHHSTSTLYTH